VNEFLLVLGVGLLAALLTWLGAPLAERFAVPDKVVSGALQFASGVIIGLVAITLMPPAIGAGSVAWVALAFFVGGAFFVGFEYYTSLRAAAQGVEAPGIIPHEEAMPADKTAVVAEPLSLALYVGILVDLLIDGMVIGISSTLTPAAGLAVALGLAVSTMPLAFVTIAMAKRQGMDVTTRRRLGWLFIMAGTLLGYLLLRNAPIGVRVVLIGLASGFLTTTVTQSMIPEANRDGEPSLSGLFFVGGTSIYALMAFYLG
jgi:ZIP family zinc transporter